MIRHGCCRVCFLTLSEGCNSITDLLQSFKLDQNGVHPFAASVAADSDDAFIFTLSVKSAILE